MAGSYHQGASPVSLIYTSADGFPHGAARSSDGKSTRYHHRAPISTITASKCTNLIAIPSSSRVTTNIAVYLELEAMDRLFTIVVLAASVHPILCDTSGYPQKAGLERRIDRFCSRVPSTTPLEQLCEKSCGTGYTQCTNYYTCFNPGLGQVCCPDGRKLPRTGDKTHPQTTLTD